MEYYWRRSSSRSVIIFLVSFSAIFFFYCAEAASRRQSSSCSDMRCSFTSGEPQSDLQEIIHEELNKADHDQEASSSPSMKMSLGRRDLRGLGSSPPRCTSKCGKCTPCRAIHIPVPPGNPVTAEYYPEAWRCKCGNKYYMP